MTCVIEGCMTRIRPILMTVATTVLGFIPLAMGSTRIGGDGPPTHQWPLQSLVG